MLLVIRFLKDTIKGCIHLTVKYTSKITKETYKSKVSSVTVKASVFSICIIFMLRKQYISKLQRSSAFTTGYEVMKVYFLPIMLLSIVPHKPHFIKKLCLAVNIRWFVSINRLRSIQWKWPETPTILHDRKSDSVWNGDRAEQSR